MKTTMFRAGALACALTATTALTAPAMAQGGQTTPPEQRSVDDNGVDLISGDYTLSVAEASIGSGEGELALIRTGTPSAMTSNWQDMWLNQTVSGSVTTVRVVLGDRTETFEKTGAGAFTPLLANGATLTGAVGGNFIYTARDGAVITFGTSAIDKHGTSEFCAHVGANPNGCIGLALSLVRPSGARLNFYWDIRGSCHFPYPEAEYRDCTYAWRLTRVSNNFGYEIDFTFVSDGALSSDFFVRSGASLSNATVSGETPLTISYAYPSAGVTEATVPSPAGETHIWRFALGSGTFGIRRPGSTSDNISVAFGSSGVTSLVRDGLTIAYARSVIGAGATTVITQIDGDSGTPDPQTTVIASLTRGRIVSATDPLSRTTLYAYDSNARLIRTTRPEGNSIGYTYDSRGNVTEARLREKGDTGDAGDDIVSTASYPTTCSNVVTCNQPVSTTDSRGNTIDYAYDGTHGGILTVTLPAPASGATRPQTRYSYGQVTAVTGQPVYQLTGVSACRTGSAPSCVGTPDEVRTIIAYDSVNIRPTSIETRAGDNSLSATAATTYNAYGDAASVDGPLAGTDDTIAFRYDAARRRVGIISPDPDGAGSLLRRAQRFTYRPDGQASAVETGTVAGIGDSDWASMIVLEGVQTEYDGSNRPTVQRLVSGSTTHALSQTSYDGLGRVRCVAQRMNPGEFATISLPADNCTLDTEGSYGPDRIARTGYDAAGRVTKVETGVGVTGVAADEIVTTYTANGRVETLSDANGNRTTYEYDMFDRAAKTRMPSPGTTGASSTTDYEQLGYDAGSNVVSRRLRSGQTIAFSYDALGRLTQTDMPNNTTNIFEPDVAYTYDLLGRLLAATDSNTNHATFTYDALSRVTSEANLHGTASMQYDAAGRRTRLTYPGSGLYVDYVYNAAGDMIQIRENGATSGIGVLATYAYDDRGRRTSLIRGNGTVTTWAYDNVSRLTGLVQNPAGTSHDLTLGFSPNPAGQIASVTRSNDLYAWTDHYAVNRAYTTDGLNRHTAAGPATFAYDANGNLTGDGTRTYTYNAANLLTHDGATGRLLYYDPLGRLSNVIPSDWSSYRISLYDGDRVIAEDAGWGTVLRRYVFGPGIDEPLVWYEGSGTSDRHWLHADERGSVVAVSNDSGAVTQVNRYDEYGVPQGGTLTGPFGYTGQQWIPELGMYYYRARIYSPTLGRFMQTDPIGYGGGMNLYAYVLNDPVNLTDPSGLQCAGCILVVGPGSIGVFGTGSTAAASPGWGTNMRINEDSDIIDRILGRKDEAGELPFCTEPGVDQENCVPVVQGSAIVQTVTFPLRRLPPISFPGGRHDTCGSAGNGGLVPDRVFGTNISSACARHDSCYSSSATRLVCDQLLRHDIWEACNRQSQMTGCYAAGQAYFWAVRRGGRRLYIGTGNPD